MARISFYRVLYPEGLLQSSFVWMKPQAVLVFPVNQPTNISLSVTHSRSFTPSPYLYQTHTHIHSLTDTGIPTACINQSQLEQSFFLCICDQLPKFSFFSYVTNLQQLSRGTLLLLSLFYGKHLRIIKIEIKRLHVSRH